jgi:hypothetical protein
VTDCRVDFFQIGRKILKTWAKFSLGSKAEYDRRCVDFHESHSCPPALHGDHPHGVTHRVKQHGAAHSTYSVTDGQTTRKRYCFFTNVHKNMRNCQLVKTDCAALRKSAAIMDETSKPGVPYLVIVSRSSSVSLHSEREAVRTKCRPNINILSAFEHRKCDKQIVVAF